MSYFKVISLLTILLSFTSCTILGGAEPPKYAGSRFENKPDIEENEDQVLAKAYELYHQFYKSSKPAVHGKSISVNSLQNNLPSIQQYTPAFGGNSGQSYPRANYDLTKLESIGVDNLGQGYQRWSLGNDQVAGNAKNLMVLDPNTGYMYSFNNNSGLQFAQDMSNQNNSDQSKVVAINEVPNYLRRYLRRVK